MVCKTALECESRVHGCARCPWKRGLVDFGSPVVHEPVKREEWSANPHPGTKNGWSVTRRLIYARGDYTRDWWPSADGEPLVFRSRIEAELWARCVNAEFVDPDTDKQ